LSKPMALWKKEKKQPPQKKTEKKDNSEEKNKKTEPKKESWFEPEGELAIDAFQTEDYVVVQSTIAGVTPGDLDILIENEMLTIKGSRKKPDIKEKPEDVNGQNYFYQECYWGSFSREIMLPEEVDTSNIEASIKQGILTVKIPKLHRKKKRKIKVKG